MIVVNHLVDEQAVMIRKSRNRIQQEENSRVIEEQLDLLRYQDNMKEFLQKNDKVKDYE